MKIDIISILPEMFASVLSASIIGRACSSGVLDIQIHDLRNWTDDRHRTTDDYPFGGGPGMVMKPEPVFRALDEIADDGDASTVVIVSPQGTPLDQKLVKELSAKQHLVIVCGRYEGFDERIRSRADLEVSIGDYVLTGGELAAMVVVDSVSRLLPGVLGHEESALDESFSNGLLEYPQYTRPASFAGLDVPEVLLSGDHARIAAWRRAESIRRTAERRPDLLEDAELSESEREFARRIIDETE
ncbi:MAG: tRNA (guanosine(37)-N1)-methyltransferase TrmD [Coriobacteriia bacterium]|nr:tRNA (guanosine(37)-N1)-methyltransferase TrmD [Coriobacteriia bacterium]